MKNSFTTKISAYSELNQIKSPNSSKVNKQEVKSLQCLMNQQFIKRIPISQYVILSEAGWNSIICCVLQIINWRFQLKIFDFTLSQQTISKLFVFILTLKSQHTKTRLKSFVRRQEHSIRAKLYISIHWLLQYLQLQASQWLMETLFAPKKLPRNFRSEKNLKESWNQD